MRIQHNLMAMNVNRISGIADQTVSYSIDKLSSGYRINGAADDAAGLAISEKLRGQIRGLNKASRNVEDGISMIQVADGGMSRVHDILQRMRELHVQGANDINTKEDRDKVQLEIDQLVLEIDRIGRTTEFNEIKVFKGVDTPAAQLVDISGDGKGFTQKFVTPLANLELTGGAKRNVWGCWLDFGRITEENKNKLIGREFGVTCTANCSQTFKFRFTNDDKVTSEITNDGSSKSLLINVGIKKASFKTGTDLMAAILQTAAAAQKDLGYGNNKAETQIGHANGMAVKGSRIFFYALGTAANFPNNPPSYAPGMGLLKATDLDMKNEKEVKGVDYWIQSGANSAQGLYLEMPAINSYKLGINELSVADHDKASNGITKVDKAIHYVSGERGRLGAYQNRLESSLKYIDSAEENLTESESIIRDTDMAKEITAFSKSNILQNVVQSMLAQANQTPQNVLKMLAL